MSSFVNSSERRKDVDKVLKDELGQLALLVFAKHYWTSLQI